VIDDETIAFAPRVLAGGTAAAGVGEDLTDAHGRPFATVVASDVRPFLTRSRSRSRRAPRTGRTGWRWTWTPAATPAG
jgi:hypothetical protein